MITKLTDENDILSPQFRKVVIEEILGLENSLRKMDSLKRYEIYKDMTKKWVIDSLKKEFSSKTVAQMENRASNISICKKVVNKLAQAYVAGVERSAESKEDKDKVEYLAKLMDMNSKMSQTDRIFQLHKNALCQVVPEIDYIESDKESPKYNLCVRPLRPHQYDVIEDARNFEIPRVVILTDFVQRKNGFDALGSSPGDGKDQVIADSPEDAGMNQQTFIWWSDSYHFTTDDKGVIIPSLSPIDNLNPIGLLPFVNFAESQDGQFWAQGGQDLVDGSILINVLLTDMFGIANAQGWGQMVVKGSNLPKELDTGPHRSMIFEYNTGDPTPEVDFKSASPPLDMWMKMIEQYTALYLSTNNLSPATVAGKLDATQFPSGIAMLIERAESTADIQETQQMFKDKEKHVWNIVNKWLGVYSESKSLSQEFEDVGVMSEELEVELKFLEPKAVSSEKEKLDALQVRKNLGISTMVDLIKIDNPDISDDQAEEKLKKILEEKTLQVKKLMLNDQTQPLPNDQPQPIE